MSDDLPAGSLLIRIATEADIAAIEELDSFSTSPTRNLRREIQEYFGSVDPSTCACICEFLRTWTILQDVTQLSFPSF